MFLLLSQVPTTPASPEAAVSYTWLLAKMVVVLVIICLLAIIILKYVVPRLGGAKRFAAGKYIDIIARRAIDQKKNLWIVRVGKRHFFLGSADGAVTCLSELSDEDVREEIKR